MPILLAKNAEVMVTMDSQRREWKNAGFYSEDGFIKHVGTNEELPSTADTVIDLSRQIVLPGFVNTHHHLNQTLTRNLPAGRYGGLDLAPGQKIAVRPLNRAMVRLFSLGKSPHHGNTPFAVHDHLGERTVRRWGLDPRLQQPPHA